MDNDSLGLARVLCNVCRSRIYRRRNLALVRNGLAGRKSARQPPGVGDYPSEIGKNVGASATIITDHPMGQNVHKLVGMGPDSGLRFSGIRILRLLPPVLFLCVD